jgi:hypothetical protein
VQQGDVLGPEFFRWVVLCATSTYNTIVRTTAAIALTTYVDLVIHTHTRGKQHSAIRAQSPTSPTTSTQTTPTYTTDWLCRDDFEKEGPGCVEHFAIFGLNMDLGTRGKKSKNGVPILLRVTSGIH